MRGVDLGQENVGSGLNCLLINDKKILVMNMTRKPRVHYP